jgi:hypothetical protein
MNALRLARRFLVKRLVVVSLVALASLALAPSALSNPPTIVRTPIDVTLFDDVDCGFPVQIHLVGTELDVLRGDDRLFAAFPNTRATLTNLDTGRTLTVSTAGPGRITVGADGSITFVGTGPELFFFLFHGNPGITLLTGRSVDSFDAQGNETFSYVGTTRDLCAELAG